MLIFTVASSCWLKTEQASKKPLMLTSVRANDNLVYRVGGHLASNSRFSVSSAVKMINDYWKT